MLFQNVSRIALGILAFTALANAKDFESVKAEFHNSTSARSFLPMPTGSMTCETFHKDQTPYSETAEFSNQCSYTTGGGRVRVIWAKYCIRGEESLFGGFSAVTDEQVAVGRLPSGFPSAGKWVSNNRFIAKFGPKKEPETPWSEAIKQPGYNYHECILKQAN